MSKRLIGLAVLVVLMLGGLVGCSDSQEQVEKNQQLTAELQDVQKAVNENKQALDDVEARLRTLREDINRDLDRIQQDLSEYKQRNQQMVKSISGVTVSEGAAPGATVSEDGDFNWIKLLIFIVVVVAIVLFFMLTVFRPKSVDDEDFEDFDDFDDDFELEEEGEGPEDEGEDAEEEDEKK